MNNLNPDESRQNGIQSKRRCTPTERCRSVVVPSEDEGVFTMPWTATITYRPAFGSWTAQTGSEILREPTAQKENAVPTASQPDF